MHDDTLNRRQVIHGLTAAMAMAMPMAAIRKADGATPPADHQFLVVGDWGRDGTQHQREVAGQMAQAAQALGSRHVISVGDNFYDEGVRSSTDPQWRTSFEAVYSAPSLQIPWYVALGNHDYRGVPQAQIDYTRVSPRWRMPDRYYKVPGVAIGAPHLDLFVIDTSPLVHAYRADVHGAIAHNVAGQDVQAQLRWLDRELGASMAPWKLVVGHHTIHSGGSGHGDTPETTELIEPLLRKHQVQAYINGHDHDLQHIRRGGVDYLCCGAGSEVRPVAPIEGTLFCAARSGFAALRSTPDSLAVEFRDFTGATLYRAEVPAAKGNAKPA